MGEGGASRHENAAAPGNRMMSLNALIMLQV